jgi:hypothetical protein
MFKSIRVDSGRAGEFEQLVSLLPPFARALLGPSVASVMSFSGIVCLGYFDLATVPASEVETGFAELILARSLQRHWRITHDHHCTSLCTALSARTLNMNGGTLKTRDRIQSSYVSFLSADALSNPTFVLCPFASFMRYYASVPACCEPHQASIGWTKTLQQLLCSFHFESFLQFRP